MTVDRILTACVQVKSHDYCAKSPNSKSIPKSQDLGRIPNDGRDITAQRTVVLGLRNNEQCVSTHFCLYAANIVIF